MWAFATYATSELGLVRDGNEDAALVSPTLIAVADGMGGHVGGEVASRLAIHTLKKLAGVLDEPTIDVESREDLLLNIGVEIDQEISEHTERHPDLNGMGTTLTALHLEGKSVELLHIGDSRCYRFRNGELSQLSYDHTVMQELMDHGRLTPDEVAHHPQRSMLTQVLMGIGGIDPVLQIYPTKIGDRFLICSDGLSSVVDDALIQEVIASFPADQVVNQLVEKTKELGAPDNITILFSEVVEVATQVSKIELLGSAYE